jgi:hypothetical protein
MKKILKITETVDNWGGVDTYETPKDIKSFLEDPSSFSDDVTFEFVEDEKKGICFIDDLIGHEVMVGDDIILVGE